MPLDLALVEWDTVAQFHMPAEVFRFARRRAEPAFRLDVMIRQNTFKPRWD